MIQKEYKSKLDWMGKMIHWELCKRLKFGHADKWYMYKPESVQRNEPHKIFLDFEVEKYYKIPTRKPKLCIN